MIGWICKFLRSERASVLPTLAITLPVVMGMTALGTDGSFYVMKNQTFKLQLMQPHMQPHGKCLREVKIIWIT